MLEMPRPTPRKPRKNIQAEDGTLLCEWHVQGADGKWRYCGLPATDRFRGGYVKMGDAKAVFCKEHRYEATSDKVNDARPGSKWEWDSEIHHDTNKPPVTVDKPERSR